MLHTTNPEFDALDQEIRDIRAKGYDVLPGPRVGDFLRVADGKFLRFTYDWGTEIQTTVRPTSNSDSGSFYLGDGEASYSGGLESAIDKRKLRDTGEKRLGSFWFFHHNYRAAHNGVSVKIPCRVFELIEADLD